MGRCIYHIRKYWYGCGSCNSDPSARLTKAMNNGTDVVAVTADGAVTAIHQQGRQQR